jgi:membrane associated rhomboid family serine protease
MGLYDRDYTQSGSRQQHYGVPQMRFNLPTVTPVVKWLLIINTGVFVLCALSTRLSVLLGTWFAVDTRSLFTALQPWRLITYQFLHASDTIWHIFMNMIGLYFLGPPLERHWSSRRFLPFYLLCGASGGIFYLLLSGVGFLEPAPMIGASGSILGMLAACAILFPHFVLFVVVFPVPIRVAAVVFGFAYFLVVVTRLGGNVGGHAAHLAGMATGAGYVLLGPKLRRYKLKIQAGSWEKEVQGERALQIEVDRILAKVHNSGLHSLTSKEKRTLKKATQEELKRTHLR